MSLLVREGSVTDREAAFATSGDTVVPTSLSASVMHHDLGNELQVIHGYLTVLAESDLERIFERGYSGHGSSGSGLGTYIVSTVVESYGGSIAVGESDSGGACFEIPLRTP